MTRLGSQWQSNVSNVSAEGPTAITCQRCLQLQTVANCHFRPCSSVSDLILAISDPVSVTVVPATWSLFQFLKVIVNPILVIVPVTLKIIPLVSNRSFGPYCSFCQWFRKETSDNRNKECSY